MAIDVSSEPVFLSKKRRISTDVSSGLIFLTHKKNVIKRREKGCLMIINQFAEYLVPAGGVYSSSVTSQASRAATELVPIAALVMASPMVN